MKPPRLTYKKSYQFKLKPMAAIIFTLFAGQANAELLTLAQADAQDKQLKQCIESASGSRAKAQCKTNAQQQAQLAADEAFDKTVAAYEQLKLAQMSTAPINEKNIKLAQADDVDAVLLGDDTNAGAATNQSRAGIKVSPELIRSAEATDTSKSNAPNKINTPNNSKDSKALSAKEGKDLPLDIKTKAVQVRAKRFYQIGPMPGLGLTKEEIPGNVQSITAKEIKESHALSLTDLMNSHLQSVNVNDYQSNPFQMDVTYRGFTASPQLGTAQGLSVFLDGIRVNEPFGDVVNWDMIPLNALGGLDVFPGSNPIFGLGTLGGAISMRTKSGFDSNEGTLEALGGSFNRKQFQGSVGGNNGVIAGFFAANLFKEDGWRENSPSKVNQLFGKAEWRNEKLQVGLSTLYAGNDLIGNGLLPGEILAQDPSKVFTSPDETTNRLLQFQLTSQWDVSDTFNITSQVYRRNSKRHASTGDINTDFGGIGTRKPRPGERIANGYADINQDGLPDYTTSGPYNIAADQYGALLDNNGNPSAFVDFDADGNIVGFTSNPNFDSNNLAIGTNVNTQVIAQQAKFIGGDGKEHLSWNFNYINPTTTLNAPLPTAYYNFALNYFKNNENVIQNAYLDKSNVSAYINPLDNGIRVINYYKFSAEGNFPFGFSDNNGFYTELTINDHIYDAGDILAPASAGFRLGKPLLLPAIDNQTLSAQPRDGAQGNTLGPGYIPGTAIGLITTTDIDQISTGGAVQLNWNLEHHKLMVGASVDNAESTYKSAQLLALIDAKHRVYADPDNIGEEYAAKDRGIGLNNFAGNSSTKSLYASETWSPIETLHLNAAARYNATTINNKLDVINTAGLKGTSSFLNFYQQAVLCTGVLPDGSPNPDSCPAAGLLPFSIERAVGLGALTLGETEKFTYYSLNPSLGATWQVTPATNVYGNWSQGARTPSVIEAGCAYDATPIKISDDTVAPAYRPRSLYERRFCTLPSILSGDPYLPQVISRTTEVGARGYWGQDIEWNFSVYRSNLTNDIYFSSPVAERNFFQSIGSTRRQGIEMGFKGQSGKLHFRVNYSLTDATFQSSFNLDSPHNSSAGSTRFTYDPIIGSTVGQVSDYGQIQVKPGNKMPGVPLHNMNVSFDYDLTEKWNIGLSMIMHSSAFVRGNENNQHKVGPLAPIYVISNNPNAVGQVLKLYRPDVRYSGKTAGYAVFNLKTSYKLGKEWTLGLQVNNIFDRLYASAGRLGINPFSPSINGAIGPSGFNYNSNDWQQSTFYGPGAPRSAFISLTYDFDLNK